MAATYRIGPSDFFLPSDLAADADTVNSQVNALDDATDGNNAIAADTWNALQAFVSQWRKFYSGNFGGFFTNLATAANDGNRDQLIAFENELADWWSKLAPYGVTNPGVNVNPSTGAQDTLANHIRNQTDKLGFDWTAVKWIAGLGAVALAAYFFRRPLGRLLAKGAT